MEIYMNVSVTTSVTTPWGGAYISPVIAGFIYPKAFVESPFVIMSLKGNGIDGGWIMSHGTGTADISPALYITRGDSLLKEATFNLNIFARGYWKK